MNTNKIIRILEEYGITKKVDLDPLRVSSEYTISLDVLKDISVLDIPVQFLTVRDIHFKNDWHDEKLTQVNVYIIREKVGMGTVKTLVKDVLKAYYGGIKEEWKSEYIEDLVPAVEVLVDGRNVAGGGFVRNNVMDACGLKGMNCVVASFIMERF